MLSGDQVRRLLSVDAGAPGVDLDAAAIQPNGVDLSLDGVWRIAGRGALGRSNADRVLPDREPLAFDADDWLELPAGAYGIRYAEWVALPKDCGGLCFPRSSLLRMGVHVPTAVWDAGYAGRGEGLLEVRNPHGVRLQRGARIVQLVGFRLTEAAPAGYAGSYQHENRRSESSALRILSG
jgi:dUTP pyrophosphatase